MAETSAHRRNRAAVVERESQVVQWVSEGMTLTEVGRRLGVTQQRASQIWYRALDRIPAANVAQCRANQQELIKTATRELFEIIRNPQASYTARVLALTALRGWADREAKLMGADMPARSEITHLSESTVDAAIRELQGEMMVRAAEAGVDLPALR